VEGEDPGGKIFIAGRDRDFHKKPGKRHRILPLPLKISFFHFISIRLKLQETGHIFQIKQAKDCIQQRYLRGRPFAFRFFHTIARWAGHIAAACYREEYC
jgi:hypothetical protein